LLPRAPRTVLGVARTIIRSFKIYVHKNWIRYGLESFYLS